MGADRKFTVFEKLIFVIGLGVIGSGLYIINQIFRLSGSFINTDVLIGITLWLLLIFILIICAIAENAREELGIIISETAQEIKLLRDISNEQMTEIRMLRQIMAEQLAHFKDKRK